MYNAEKQDVETTGRAGVVPYIIGFLEHGVGIGSTNIQINQIVLRLGV